MKKERVLKLTFERYYKPSEVSWTYDELLEANGRFNVGTSGHRSLWPSTDNKRWLDENLQLAGAYDKNSLDTGEMEPKQFLEFSENELADDCIYTLEIVEFTTHEDGHVSEEVICEIKDHVVEWDADEDAKAIEAFNNATGRFPSMLELLTLREAAASVALDKGDIGTYAMGEPNEKSLPQ